MAMTLDELKRYVFPGESGGDYNALYGYANRPGGQFENVRLTDMTVNEALQFSDPSGPYAATVRGQVGRTATPMGAWQVVGSTLRDAASGLGLRGDERMTPELQDRIGMWIYQNQGPGAWEGWGGGGGKLTMSSSGGPGMGLLDFEQEPKTFGEKLKDYWTSGDLLSNLALGFNSMRLNPDQNLAQALISQQEARAQRRQEGSTANRTAQWLISQGREDLAQALLSGAVDAKTAASVALTPADARGQVVDAAALRQMFPGTEIADGIYNVKPDGTITKVGGDGPSVNIDMGAGKFEEGFAKADAELLGTVYASGLAAQRNLGRLDQLEQLLQTAPQGGPGALALAAGEYGINTEGLSEAQAAQALINSLVPEQRPPGSGPMSDADLALFKQSLPRLINQPGGNAAILDTLRKISQYDAEGASIVQRLRAGEIDRATAFSLLMNRENPLSNFRAPTGGTGGMGGGTGGGDLSPEDLSYLGQGG